MMTMTSSAALGVVSRSSTAAPAARRAGRTMRRNVVVAGAARIGKPTSTSTSTTSSASASASTPRGGVALPLAALSMDAPSSSTAGTPEAPGPVPTLRELRQSIPAECFEQDLAQSLKYAALDLSALAACFAASPIVVENPWLLPLYAPLTGTIMWMVFVVGHDCGHGSFSKSNWINGIIGHICHAPLLVPFYPWAYSHKQHHRFHQHETKDMSHPWMTPERYQATNPVVRWLALDHPWGLFLGFPGYLLLEPKWSSTDGSHFNPASRLFDRAPKDERLKCAVSTVACASFLAATFAACDGPGAWFIQYGAPYLCFSWWLFTVTYLQHHDHDTKTYPEGEWEYVLGGLETIDREFGFGLDDLTHHITDCHVAHHMFSDMPHYNLPAATEGVRGVLEPRGLYKKRDTSNFLTKVFGLHNEVGHCIEPDRPRATADEIREALNSGGK